MGDLSLDLLPASEFFGDLVLTDGDLVINSGTDAIRQNVIQRLKTYLGEWFLNNQIGIPYFQQILVKNPNQGNIDAIFQDAIMGTPGIVSLNKYSLDHDRETRRLTIRFQATATEGTVDYSGLL